MPDPIALSLTPRLRSTPFTSRVRAAGIKHFTVYNHMLLPTYLHSLEEDYRHLCQSVQLWDVSAQRQVEIRGPDALSLVELMTPRDISRCAVGQCKYAPLVDSDGGIVNDPVILRLAADHFWISVADSDVLLWARGLAAGGKMDVEVEEPDVSPLALQGPVADTVAEALFGSWVRSLRFFRFRDTEIDGIPVVLARSGWGGQGGFEIYLRNSEKGEALWDRIWSAGEVHGIRAGAPNLIDRIETRLLSYGSDMTRQDDPFEAGLEAYCDLDKPAAYLARQTLDSRRNRPPARRLERLVIDGDPIEPNTDRRPLFAPDHAPAGFVSSAVHSPRLGRNIALAMLATEHRDKKLQVRLANGTMRPAMMANEHWEPASI
ncbi:dimethylsulfoniopropionate demethylase [Thioalkalivibrio sp. HK1]|uniref:dimethylsulfoniopropionate demethylase n=1 Tax=Thioalkalivibrio sp. HK1 TaxID=1469245 RepID=UPI000470ECB9|nr:dimethylsulfoniopropionate demethylase [Thioalkalivibrio sp. HK1]